MLSLLGEQMEQLRPENKPSTEQIAGARASATVTNSYVAIIRLGMEYSRMQGKKPDLGFLKIDSVEEKSPKGQTKLAA